MIVQLCRVDSADTAVVAALPAADQAERDVVACFAYSLAVDQTALLEESFYRLWRVVAVDVPLQLRRFFLNTGLEDALLIDLNSQ